MKLRYYFYSGILQNIKLKIIIKLYKQNLFSYIYCIKAGIAQLVEQWIEDPRVPSSNLGLPIYYESGKVLKNLVGSS